MTAETQKHQEQANRHRLMLLSLGHGTVDAYGQSFVAPLLPLLIPKLGLSLGLAGTLATVLGLSASLSQPLYGVISDRIRGLHMVILGPAVAAVFCSLIGRAPSYAALLSLLLLAGVGIAAYHPQGAALAGQASGPRKGLGMSLFTVGGNIGFGVSPLLATFLADKLGLEGLYWAALPGLVVSLLLWRRLRGVTWAPARPADGGARNGGDVFSLVLLTTAVLVRSAVHIGFTAFLPLYLVELGYRSLGRGVIVSAFLLSGSIAGPLGGWLSDRYGRKLVLLLSFLSATPALFLTFALHQPWALVTVVLGGFLLALPVPVNVVMAQELLPGRSSIATSLITGLAWGLASLLATPMGLLAEATSLQALLMTLSVLPLLGAALVVPIRAAQLPEAEPAIPAAQG